jgi:hypothetical protein
MTRFNAVLHGVMGKIVHHSRSQRKPHRHTSSHHKRLDDAIVARLGIIVNHNERGWLHLGLSL